MRQTADKSYRINQQQASPVGKLYCSRSRVKRGEQLVFGKYTRGDPEAAEKADVTLKTLAELGAGEIPVVTVLNKCDKLTENIPVLPCADNKTHRRNRSYTLSKADLAERGE